VPALAWLLGLPVTAAMSTSPVILGVNSLAGLSAHLGRLFGQLPFRVRNTSAVVTTRTTVPIDSTTSVVGANW
jgi:hypothetical protein